MNAHTIGRVWLWVAEGDAYAPYYREALAHFGLWHETPEAGQGPDLTQCDVLALAGEGKLDPAWTRSIREWVEGGGRLIVSGGTWGLDDLLGIEVVTGRKPSTGTLRCTPGAEAFWPPESQDARYFGGQYATTTQAQSLATTDSGHAAMTQRSAGAGAAFWFGPHIGQTMALMQMGRGVCCDGVGPNDGSAQLIDGRLRAEDGIALDFDADRCPGGWFERAHADIVKEAWLRMLLRALESAGKRPVILWHWPKSADGASTVSVDCDTFEPEYVTLLYRAMANYGAMAAWTVSMPGYPLDTYRTMRKWEHEVALLYVPDDGVSAERFKTQYVALNRATATTFICSARAVDGGWFGWLEFYEAAESVGCRQSISKGGRQPGTSGFAFGTCHPFYPRRRDGTRIRVAELPYQLFEPGVASPAESIEPVLREAALRHGCAHIAVRVSSAKNETVIGGLAAFATTARSLRLVSMTPEKIALFERARRQMRVSSWGQGPAFGLTLISDTPIEGLTVLIGGPPVALECAGKPVAWQVQQRYGTDFTAFSLDFEPKSQIRVASQDSSASAA